MAADLDHRSPDASQWGVGSSSGVVGVGARDGAAGGRGCSASRRAVSSSSSSGAAAEGVIGGGGGEGRCWPSSGGRRALVGAASGSETWGSTEVEAESTEMLDNSNNGGLVVERQSGQSGSRERSSRQQQQRACAASGGVSGCYGLTTGCDSSSHGGGGCGGSSACRRRDRGGDTSSSSNRNSNKGKERRKCRDPVNLGAPEGAADEREGEEEFNPSEQDEDLSVRTSILGDSNSGGGGGGAGTRRGATGTGDAARSRAPRRTDLMDTGLVYDERQGCPQELSGAGGVEEPVGVGGTGQAAAVAVAAVSVGLDEGSDGDGGVSDMGGAGGGRHVGGGGVLAAGAGTRAPGDRLAFKLSVNLIDTYKLINQRYYAEKSRQQEQSLAAARGGRGGRSKPAARQGGVYNHGLDDENFDYIVHEGEIFHGRYAVRETIGKGSFGKVYKAWDEKDKIYVALKVIKSKRPFTMQARVEVEILEMLRDRDPDGKYNCARMLDEFMSHNHQCLVFEILSFNLYELLRSTQFQGVSLHLVRKFARHLLRALAFLSLPQVDVIHCDLKPENILLQHPKRSNIKVIDFGSSCRSHNKMYSYIQSRFYRSPEVMLGLPYTTAIDMWSLGCILVEMHTGEPLFAGVDQFDQMCRIVSVIGMTPTDVVERSPPSNRDQFFEVDTSSDEHEDTGSNSDGNDGGNSDDEGSQGILKRCADDQGTTIVELPEDGRTAGWSSAEKEAAARKRAESIRGGGSGGGGGGARRDGATASTTDDYSDDDMVDCSLGRDSPSSGPRSSPSRRPFNNQRRRYRLRRHLLLKRARNLGASGGSGGREGGAASPGEGWTIPPRIPLSEVVGVNSGGPSGRREGEAGHDPETYGSFVNLVERMLDHRPETRITPAEALRHPFMADPPPSHVSPPPNTVGSNAVDSWLTPSNNSFGAGAAAGASATTTSQHQHREHPTTPTSVVADSNERAGASTTVGISERITPDPPPDGSDLEGGSDCDDDNRDRDEAFNNFMEQRPRSAPERQRPARGGGRGRGRAGANSGGSGSASMVGDAAADEGGEADRRRSSRLTEGSENNNNNNNDNLTGAIVAALRSTDALHADAALADQSAERRNRYRGHGNAHDREGDGGPRGTRVNSSGSSSGGVSGCGSRVVGEKGSGGGSSSSGGGRGRGGGGGKGAGAARSGSGSRGRLTGPRRIRSIQGVGGSGGGGGASFEASAKKSGQRSRREVARLGGGEDSNPRHVGNRRRVKNPRAAGAGDRSPLLSPTRGAGVGLSVETRRGKAVRRVQGRLAGGVAAGAAPEGHVEAASGVAQLSLHSVRSGSRRCQG